jgi:hypothetical protein
MATGRTLESLGGRVLDYGPFGWRDLPAAARRADLLRLELAVLLGSPELEGEVALRFLQKTLRLRLVKLPIAAVRKFVVLPLSDYDDEGEPAERRKTEKLIAALRAGATLPPPLVLIGPYFAASRPVDVLDGYHRVTAQAALGHRALIAYELVLPAGHVLLRPPNSRAAQVGLNRTPPA